MSRYGKLAQDKLRALKIDINSPSNGVFLPGCGTSGAVGMIHCGKHTEAYERAVWSRLENLNPNQTDDAINVLSDIRNALLRNDGSFTSLNIRSTGN